MERKFVMSMFASLRELQNARAAYCEENRTKARAAGYTVEPHGDGFVYAFRNQAGSLTSKRYDMEDDAWEAAALRLPPSKAESEVEVSPLLHILTAASDKEMAAPVSASQGAYIEEPDDPELLAAWKTLRARVGSLAGWQYGGSVLRPDGWLHCFTNRRLREEARYDDSDAVDPYQEVIASAGWKP